MNKEKVIEINKLLRNLNNDSKKLSESSRNELNKIAKEHFQKIYNICEKIGYDYFSRYYGGDLVKFDWREKNRLYFLLSCKNCDESDQKSITIEDLSDFNYEKFQTEIKQKRIDYLLKVIDSHKAEIIKYREQLNKLI